MNTREQTTKTFGDFTFTFDHPSQRFCITNSAFPKRQDWMTPSQIASEIRDEDEDGICTEWLRELSIFAGELGVQVVLPSKDEELDRMAAIIAARRAAK